MIRAFYNQKDATIYEQLTQLNTGLDSILDVQKVEVSATTSSYFNSRVLVKFDTSDILNTLGGATATGSATKYYLKLYATEPSEIPVSYTLYAYPITGSWNMGTGRYGSIPTSSNGVSWLYKANSSTPSSAWVTGSHAANTTGSWSSNKGGGNWFTNYAASQSFDYSLADIEMDVTSIVKAWISGSIPNEGFILKKSDTDEQSTSTFGSLKFFSKDTHTIYQPKLEVRYDDSIYHASYSLVDYTNEVSVDLTNLQDFYPEGTTAAINVTARPKFPPRTFGTSSNYLDRYQLVSSSFYSVVDAHSRDIVVPFDEEYTKISADSRGNYFKLNFDSLQPERYYKLLVKTKVSNTEQYVYDKNWIFKVVK